MGTSTTVYFTLYFLGRFKQLAGKLAMPTAIIMALGTTSNWFLTDGVHGPGPLAILLTYVLALTFLPSRKYLTYSIFLVVLLGTLIVLGETQLIDLGEQFESSDKFVSIGFLMVMGLLLVGFLTWVMKFSYMKEKQRVVQKNEELNDFAHIVAHDMKAPLRAIQHLSNFVLEDNEEVLDKKGKFMLEKVIDSSDRMGVVINDILNFTRVSEKIYDKQEVDFEKVLKETITTADPSGNAKIDYQGIPSTVTYNQESLKQVLENLLSNAIKFNDKETPEIHITGESDGKFHWIHIKDNGPGIAAKHHELIFEYMKTLGIKFKGKGGTGIGLALVRKIVEMNEGEIKVKSEIGQGATIAFSIPS